MRRGAPSPTARAGRSVSFPRAATALVGLGLAASACGEELPAVQLELSKNCNEIEVSTLVPRVGAGQGEIVVDVAADGTLGDTAWVLLRRPTPAGGEELVVQRIGAQGVEHETVLPVDGVPSLALSPAPETGRVWVVRDEPGRFELWRVAPDDPVRPLLGSSDLSSFPSAQLPCVDCEDDWPRRLFFLPSGPALVALPPASVNATLSVWVAELDTSGAQIGFAAEHELRFNPPCDDSTPEGAAFCDEQRMSLRFPQITLLGMQQDPRQTDTALFAHRTRSQTYDGQPFPLESSDVLMVLLYLDAEGTPAGSLRSYSDLYIDDRPISNDTGSSTTSPPYGVAIDRVASYGLFSNGMQGNDTHVPRFVQLLDTDQEFVELTDRIPLATDVVLLQLDRDIALGRLDDGAWELTKLFPDDPAQSGQLRHESDAPIEAVISGGIGTFMLRKRDTPPELVRLRCPEPDEGS